MFLGLGAGAFSAGIFHLVTHAFFKALLFLGAGSVIHALGGEQDLRNMGGLRKHTPVTFLTMLCAAVAIAGVPPFSGFHSKDAILLAAYHHAPWMYWVGVLTAGMTAFYVFRAVFLAFFGDLSRPPPPARIAGRDDAAAGGAGGAVARRRLLRRAALARAAVPASRGGHDAVLVYISVAAGLAGIALAYLFYIARPGLADAVHAAGWAGSTAGLQQVLRG